MSTRSTRSTTSRRGSSKAVSKWMSQPQSRRMVTPPTCRADAGATAAYESVLQFSYSWRLEAVLLQVLLRATVPGARQSNKRLRGLRTEVIGSTRRERNGSAYLISGMLIRLITRGTPVKELRDCSDAFSGPGTHMGCSEWVTEQEAKACSALVGRCSQFACGQQATVTPWQFYDRGQDLRYHSRTTCNHSVGTSVDGHGTCELASCFQESFC